MINSLYNELTVQQALAKMKSEWKMMNLNFVAYKETGVQILAALDDVQALLDDHIVKTTTMKNSPFIKPFEKDVTDWDHHMVHNLIKSLFYVLHGQHRICIRYDNAACNLVFCQQE